MFLRVCAIALAACLSAAAPAFAALNVGDRAPAFTAQASLGGKVFSFDLASALKRGPVVLYFYPAAFTTGCTLEAHDFAAAISQYKKLNATVIGVSHDTIDTLNKFSVSECRSKFAVAADPELAVAKSYDAVLPVAPQYANRTSYVISQDGKIAYAYTNLNPGKHVQNTLDALKQMKAKAKMRPVRSS
ncbi:MAG: peroxiredoxin [Candidatus Eremiobacteraeota bacterium]|nr:peroxiredoxin [Candidatus Eremiobacteraeota bacterium]